MSEEQQEVTLQGPGQILKQARERANLSHQDIANRIKLKKVVIEALERDNYDMDVSQTFLKGYLKLYAKQVSVDESEILKAFECVNSQSKEPAKLQSFSRRVTHQANDDKLMLVTYLIVAVVIALVVIWWFQQNSMDSNGASNDESYTETVANDSASNDKAVQDSDVKVEPTLEKSQSTITATKPSALQDDISLEDSPTISLVQPELAQENGVVAPNSEGQAATFEGTEPEMDSTATTEDVLLTENATITPEISEPVELVFEFSDNCWMNLTDATGEDIAYGVKTKGRVMPITGIPPFVVTLGAPQVVKISYAGEAVDLSFLPAGRSAKFDLPVSE
ncbi:RodZ domain-containing protein [uncultured Paraglaciecola sp.]|uniref:RodZ domain-containing protein n=1 Tax=uncultured Paraglaciecola sp. TaxID=1765024 RepID=UPI00262B07D3|nr:RodZ domain-containing protein [uncultured Paraglaciecola sp.]